MRIIRSALKHGLEIGDIMRVIDSAYYVTLLRDDPTKWLYLGFSRSGTPLEVISVLSDDGQETIIHAMPTTGHNHHRSQQ